MRNSVKAGANIAFEYPLCTILPTQGNEACFDGICCRAGCPKSRRVRVSRRLRNRVKSQQVEGLHGSITHRENTQPTLFAVWSANGSLHPPPIQNRACELLRTRLLSVRSHLREIPSCSNFRSRSLITVISASHSS